MREIDKNRECVYSEEICILTANIQHKQSTDLSNCVYDNNVSVRGNSDTVSNENYNYYSLSIVAL